MKRHREICALCVAVLAIAPATAFSATRVPTSPASAVQAQESSTKADRPGKKKNSHANDFLIRGTVFNEKTLSFPGVGLRIRREGQKKYKWETVTNSRGEFAVRVPQGSNYEILVHVKGFANQIRTIDAKSGGNEETVAFRMAPVTGGKK